MIAELTGEQGVLAAFFIKVSLRLYLFIAPSNGHATFDCHFYGDGGFRKYFGAER